MTTDPAEENAMTDRISVAGGRFGVTNATGNAMTGEALSPAALAVQAGAKALLTRRGHPPILATDTLVSLVALEDARNVLHAAVSDPAVREALVEALHRAWHRDGSACPPLRDGQPTCDAFWYARSNAEAALSALDPGEGAERRCAKCARTRADHEDLECVWRDPGEPR